MILIKQRKNIKENKKQKDICPVSYSFKELKQKFLIPLLCLQSSLKALTTQSVSYSFFARPIWKVSV